MAELLRQRHAEYERNQRQFDAEYREYRRTHRYWLDEMKDLENGLCRLEPFDLESPAAIDLYGRIFALQKTHEPRDWPHRSSPQDQRFPRLPERIEAKKAASSNGHRRRRVRLLPPRSNID
jgi:hypothetical protein